MSAYDLPDPSDIPGTSDFAYAQEQMRRDAEVDDLVEHEAVKQACIARLPDRRYRIVIGNREGVILDGIERRVDAVMTAFGLDHLSRWAALAALLKGKTVGVIQLDNGRFILWEVDDPDGTGIPEDPARFFYDKLAFGHWGAA